MQIHCLAEDGGQSFVFGGFNIFCWEFLGTYHPPNWSFNTSPQTLQIPTKNGKDTKNLA